MAKETTKAPRRGGTIVFWTLVTTVLLTPLPFASVYAWSWSLLACIVAILLAAWSVRVVLGFERPPRLGLRTTWPVVALFAGAVAWAVLQTTEAVPPDWYHPLWQSAGEALGVELSPAVSLNPYETWSTLTRFLTYAGIFWLSLQYCRRATRARQVFVALTVVGLVYAAYGLAVQFSGSQTILWFDKFAYENDVTSTFVNRNSYATYAGLGLLCATGLLLVLVSDSLRTSAALRERILRLVEGLSGRGWVLAVAWIIILTALILSHSRAGFFATFIGLVVLISVMGLTRSVKGRSAMIFGAACVAGLAVFLVIGGEGLDQRLARTSVLTEERPRVYALTLQAIDAAPWIGTGLGSFEEVFRFYRTPQIHFFYLKAHSTYLENVLELGLPAALALFGVFAWFLVVTYRGIRARRKDAVYPCIGFAATVLVAVHSIVDFSLQIPAVTATYALLMGAACGQSWSSRRAPDAW